jgi:hypothetical protein
MTDQTPAPTAEVNALLTPAQEMNKFEGYSTRDGERVTTTPAAPDAANKPAKVTADTPETAADGSDDAPEQTEAEKHKSAQQRINKAVGRQRAAERRAEAAEKALQDVNVRLLAIEQRTSNPTPTPKPKIDPNAPQPADYEYGEVDVRYIKDLTRYETKKEYDAQQQKTQQEQQTQKTQQAQQEGAAKFKDFIAKGLELHDDFDEIVLDDGVPFSQSLVELIFESEFGHEIAYEAASDPKVRKLLSGMTPARQAAWFGRQEASRSSESSDADDVNGDDEEVDTVTSTPQTTKAPKPLKNKQRGNGAPKPASPDTTNFAQFEQMAMSK